MAPPVTRLYGPGGNPKDLPRLSQLLGDRIRQHARQIDGLLPAAERPGLRCALDRLGVSESPAQPGLCAAADAATLTDVLATLPDWPGQYLFAPGETEALQALGSEAVLTATCGRLAGCAGRCDRLLRAPLESPAQIEALLRGPRAKPAPRRALLFRPRDNPAARPVRPLPETPGTG